MMLIGVSGVQLVCKVINKIQWLQRGNNYDYLPITSVIMDRIGLHKVLLPIINITISGKKKTFRTNISGKVSN